MKQILLVLGALTVVSYLDKLTRWLANCDGAYPNCLSCMFMFLCIYNESEGVGSKAFFIKRKYMKPFLIKHYYCVIA